MQQHQPSNFATYSDAHGNAVFDTFFVLSDWGNGDELFAFTTPRDRTLSIDVFKAQGMRCEEKSHQEAFLLIRDGVRAWIHQGDVPAERTWLPLKINFPAACVA